MVDFASGLVTMGHLVLSLFFLRFWTRTRDPLFAVFSIAFALFALEQILLMLGGGAREEQTWFYLLRLVAFLLIIGGIVQKNRAGREPE